MPTKPPLLEPSATTTRRSRGAPDDGVVFAVYAPFGTDETLSRFPLDDAALPQPPIGKQALVRALQKVAAEGVNVCALVDLFEDDSWLVEIPAFLPKAVTTTSVWKQDMSAPQALAGFLRRVQQRFPCKTVVLALEGHGGGFVPAIDFARITPSNSANWSQGGQQGRVRWVQSEGNAGFEPDPPGSPALPMTAPILPMTAPILPATRLPMSTWALGEALRSAIASGVPRPAVIHFNNCFNASVELLHTVAPYADVATGYANYDFFTAGEAYATVFKRLRLAGSASRLQLAQWFAEENGNLLRAKKNHPSVGATVVLSRMKELAAAIDRLATALTAALRPAIPAQRQAALDRIQKAAVLAQHYDTEPGFELQAPDQFVDLGSFAVQLQAQFAAGSPVAQAAAAVQSGVTGLWVYGDWDRPWMDETRIWDFRARHLGLNILLPDPALQGVWDWRSPYYLSGTVDPTKAPAQRHVIGFLADRPGAPGKPPASPPWVEFIVEYHRTVPFVGFLPPRPPLFPIYNLAFKNRLPHPGDNPPPTTGTTGTTGKGRR